MTRRWERNKCILRTEVTEHAKSFHEFLFRFLIVWYALLGRRGNSKISLVNAICYFGFKIFSNGMKYFGRLVE